MAASNINLITSNFSYVPNITTQGDFTDFIINFLVNGFDPLPIESITVTNKVARVITVEKSFLSCGGCKMVIAGTGVTAIDTKQEIEDIFYDGFSFNVDSPDATYTNTGMTYVTPPLGWELTYRDNSNIIFRNGPSSNNRFNFVISPILIDTNKNGFVKGYLTFDANDIKSIKQTIPFQTNNEILFPIPIDVINTGNPITFWIYGDDSFVIVTASKNSINLNYGPQTTKATKFHCNNTAFAFGQVINITSDAPLFYVNGGTYNTANYINNTGTNGNSLLTYLHDGSAINMYMTSYSSKQITGAIRNNNGDLRGVNLTIQPNFTINITPAGAARSGYMTNNVRNLNNNLITKTYLGDQNNNYEWMGIIPGLYQEYFAYLTNNVLKPFKRYKMTIDNKVRNFVTIGTSLPYDAAPSWQSNTYLSSISLDLTGPIR